MSILKYKEGDRIGPNNILFKKRLNKDRGIFECPLCGKDFECCIYSITRKNKGTKSCGCYRKKTAIVNGQTAIKDLTNKKFGLLTVKEITTQRYHNSVVWKCVCECGNIKYVSSHQLQQNAVISCGCLKSKGELKIQKILEQKNIKFETEKIFKGCKNPLTNKNLRFDFYLPDYNCCIEYDGEQHFKSIDSRFFSSDLTIIKERDSLKNKYCKQNNIKLIRIPYIDYSNINKQYLFERIFND